MAAVAFYISGHGFGHASRQIEVINALGAACPRLDLLVRTSAPEWLFRRSLRVPARVVAAECDTGLVQLDGLRLDVRQSLARAAAFHRTLSARAAEEARWLSSCRARVVIADAPPLACAAAGQAGIPSVVLSNFTWDWIYQGYEEHREFPDLVPTIAGAYRLATAGWRLPMHGGFAPIETVVDLPFVARHARHARSQVRAALDLPDGLPLALVSFGGYGVQGLDLARLDCLGPYGIVVTTRAGEGDGSFPAGVYAVAESRMYGSGFRYEDLVAAVDVVVTKPGYGIIADCVANGAAILYTSRGRFAEYDVLVHAMPRYLRCRFIDREALLAGRWRQALDQLLAEPLPPDRPDTNGAGTAVTLIRDLL